ncbi:ABC transporter ATP-binding protein [Clostridium estertheticum]|uniref:ABC transporter ATP-binding protein n=1 Tax=Clostridium estertheticum TaxID=238834 RepID=UPI001C0C5676|nr:ABC transporter ATP-binding protein [Clostridium estertheticum]MBU3201630.1 ABC transporter ATP-binding protein [Clostridium estertheticum]WAG67870.1 ABC transporter ATP-binding protein [Clostridium estertheticum]
MNIIELKNVTKGYEEKMILNKCNLSVKNGEIIAIKGVSGKGKSTLHGYRGQGFNLILKQIR